LLICLFKHLEEKRKAYQTTGGRAVASETENGDAEHDLENYIESNDVSERSDSTNRTNKTARVLATKHTNHVSLHSEDDSFSEKEDEDSSETNSNDSDDSES